ncbi:MAG: tRNA dihydrouridine synthase DusB [Candidatus Cloacimonetes bacterium]|nr:tRNA dihydrouridine synthase DusB [Candidatus Cloacimonadota bacterium]
MKSQELFEKKLWLAPLAGYTDYVYRKLCKRFGADVVLSEMISADALIHENKKTEKLAEFDANDRPIGLQVFSNTAYKIVQGINILQKYHPNFFDINMGCPIKKVVKNGSGSALLKNPKEIAGIVRETKKLMKDFPFTVKIRIGWNSDEHFDEIVKIIEHEGASALTVHARTRSQMFSGKSDWHYIARAKELVSIPIIGNGDILTPENAIRMFAETSCDSIMIGRGALGNPWLFSQIKSILKGHEIVYSNYEDRLNIMKEHFERSVAFYGESTAIKLFRKFVPFYTKGMTGSSHLRDLFNHLTTKNKIIDVINSFKQSVING